MRIDLPSVDSSTPMTNRLIPARYRASLAISYRCKQGKEEEQGREDEGERWREEET